MLQHGIENRQLYAYTPSENFLVSLQRAAVDKRRCSADENVSPRACPSTRCAQRAPSPHGAPAPQGPTSAIEGATPTQAAICRRVSVPNSESSSSNVQAHRPNAWALCNMSSFSRHSGLARSVVSTSSSSVAMRALSQAIWPRCPVSGTRRPREAVLCCGPHADQLLAAPGGAQRLRLGVGSGRGMGGSRRHRGQRRASNASLLAHRPVARAQSRACRGSRRRRGARRRQRRRGDPLQAAGGFQHNQGGVEGL